MSSRLYDKIINVKVGPKAKVYGIHNALVCGVSLFFRAALAGNFKKGAIDLIEESTDVFDCFNAWLYTRILIDNQTLYSKPSDPDISNHLCAIYIFAEKYLIPRLQNACIDALINRAHKTQIYHVSGMVHIWENTREGSPLRRYLTDSLARYGSHDEMVEAMANKDILLEVMRELFECGRLRSRYLEYDHHNSWANKCRYHTDEKLSSDEQSSSSDSD